MRAMRADRVWIVMALLAVSSPVSAQEVVEEPAPEAAADASSAPAEGLPATPTAEPPAVSEPQSASATVEVQAPEASYGGSQEAIPRPVEVRFESSPPGLGLALVTEPGFTRHATPGSLGVHMVQRVPGAAHRLLCTAPCRGTIPPGLHTFGLHHPNGEVWVALPPIQLRAGQPMRIRGTLIDNSDLRLGGGLFLVLGGLGGLGGMGAGLGMLMSTGMTSLQTVDGQVGFAIAIGFGVLSLIALAVGLPAAFAPDRAWVEGIPIE